MFSLEFCFFPCPFSTVTFTFFANKCNAISDVQDVFSQRIKKCVYFVAKAKKKKEKYGNCTCRVSKFQKLYVPLTTFSDIKDIYFYFTLM